MWRSVAENQGEPKGVTYINTDGLFPEFDVRVVMVATAQGGEKRVADDLIDVKLAEMPMRDGGEIKEGNTKPNIRWKIG